MLSHKVFPTEVAERLGPFYVYMLIDPRDGRPFYVGKGTRQRLLDHGVEADLTAEETLRSLKVRRIREIRNAGHEPRIDIVKHGLESESVAFAIEAALIDSVEGLTNAVAGHGAAAGRRPLPEYIAMYGATPVPGDAPPVVLIRLGSWKAEPQDGDGVTRAGRGYRPGMTIDELVDSTRAWWRISQTRIQRDGIRHAVAVHDGITRGVIEIGGWTSRHDGRRAFVGTPIMDGPVHEAWVGPFGRKVLFTVGAQSPVMYWPRR